MLFGLRKKERYEETTEFKFKPFHETYKWIAVTLTFGLMYPNPTTERIRFILIVCLLVMTQPVILMILYDMKECWLRRDMFNIIRHSTIIGPYLGAFFKMFLMFYKRVQAKELIDEINRDYESYNYDPRHRQVVADSYVKRGVARSELWATVVSFAIMMFPGMAVVSTTYSHIFEELPKKYMVHDLNIPLMEPEARFQFPYFEIMFVYMFGSALVCVINYTAYDALFGLTTNHACLKLSMCCVRLEDAFKMADPDEMYAEVLAFIKEQRKMFRFGELIQDTFNIWLGTIIISTMIQIGSLLFHINSGYGFDLRYSVFSICAVVHIYLPCSNAANLKMMSTEMSTLVYCSGWEKTSSSRVRQMIPFMVARAQIPIQIMAFNIFRYDMELFVDILRTSYSMFTLMSS